MTTGAGRSGHRAGSTLGWLSRLAAIVASLFVLCAAAGAQTPAPRFIGSAACQQCHKKEYGAWLGSQHRAAMQEADDAAVLGRFDGASVTRGGTQTAFFRKDGKFFVHTEGPDGRPGDFPIKYAFGLYPLQQYLIELSGGRLQAFGIAWDSRPAEQGGQRWFDLYPDRKLAPGDPLHWTGVDQNWNYQCAWCHATDLRKNYDAGTGAFATTFVEIGVGCEACHGPGSAHRDWAARPSDSKPDHGFAFSFDQRRGVAWKSAGAATAARSAPAAGDREALVCAGCHSRRQQFSDDPLAAARFYDAFRPTTLEPDLYHPDGQQHDEVYTFASFLQSRMHAAGVTCSDCHEPHSGKTRLSGNALCGQCHAAAVFDAETHHHHAKESTGAQCAACHMPTTVYMGVDARHDHSMRLPRPDRTPALHAPNACNNCHADKSAEWAVEALTLWRTPGAPGAQTFAETFHLADRGGVGAGAALLRIIDDENQSAIVRASALQRARLSARPSDMAAARRALSDKDPLVRSSAIAVLAQADAASRVDALVPLLSDETRLVRMDAARALAGEAEASLAPGDLTAFEKALADYEAGQAFNAERPESQANLGALYLARGKPDRARAAFERALAIDRTFAPAAIALADMARARGDETGAEDILRRSIAQNPESAPLTHALGLSLIRRKRLPDAMESLARAVALAPDDARFAYVYAVALHDTGAAATARETLTRALERHPFDRDLLMALASYDMESGDYAAAAPRAALLTQLEPDDASLRRFAELARTMAERATTK